jgi:hypothetical protein
MGRVLGARDAHDGPPWRRASTADAGHPSSHDDQGFGAEAASEGSEASEVEPLDLVHYARHSALKRVGPLVVAAMVVLLIGALVRRLRSRH